MQLIFDVIGGLAEFPALLSQIWSYAVLDRTILAGFGTGMGVYLLLIIGDATINRILAHARPWRSERIFPTAPTAAQSTARERDKRDA